MTSTRSTPDAPPVLAVGLMSGTSLDGIDAAIIETDGESRIRPCGAVTVPYDGALRDRLRAALGRETRSAETDALERDLTLAHARIVGALLDRERIAAASVAVVGFHGHTLLHRPERRLTWQIGDGALLARATGIGVVADFRSADVAAGGQGAPLAPAYHAALAAGLAKPVAMLNVGGVANVTWIGSEGALIAFDTGPGNALIDDWLLQRTGVPVDRDGALAASGTVDEAVLARLLDNPYFEAPPPKSLDRTDFTLAAVEGLSDADGAATLAAFTAAAVAQSLPLLPAPPRRWIVCGGGRHNPVLMRMLAGRLAAPVEPVEAIGCDGDFIEAQAFAYMAVRSLRGRPISWPGTTGAPTPLCGGRLFPANA
jgi:anhydro-N-acetylmuramic acid kinase